MQRHYVMVSLHIWQNKCKPLRISFTPICPNEKWANLPRGFALRPWKSCETNFLTDESFPVLRDVLRVERGDAQTNGDLQKTWRHHSPSPPVPFRRGRTSVDQMILYHIAEKSYMCGEISIYTNRAYPLPTQSQISYPHLEHCFSINNKWQLQWNAPSRLPWRSWTRWCRFVSSLVGEGTDFHLMLMSR